jgi:hypothetical protein
MRAALPLVAAGFAAICTTFWDGAAQICTTTERSDNRRDTSKVWANLHTLFGAVYAELAAAQASSKRAASTLVPVSQLGSAHSLNRARLSRTGSPPMKWSRRGGVARGIRAQVPRRSQR